MLREFGRCAQFLSKSASSRQVKGARYYKKLYNTNFYSVYEATPLRVRVRDWALVSVLGVSISYFFVTHTDRVPVTNRLRHISVTREDEEAIVDDVDEWRNEPWEELPPRRDPSPDDTDEERKEAEFVNRVYELREQYETLLQEIVQQISRAAKTIDPTFPAIDVMVVPDPTINASCGMASRLQVHAGLLAAVEVWEAQGDVESAVDALQAVIAHEVAHSLARHVAENTSYLGVYLLLKLMEASSPLLVWIHRYFIDLPFSRIKENEADLLGILLLGKCCMSIYAMPRVMQLLAGESELDALDFMSTHPSGMYRAELCLRHIAELEPSYLPECTSNRCRRSREWFLKEFDDMLAEDKGDRADTVDGLVADLINSEPISILGRIQALVFGTPSPTRGARLHYEQEVVSLDRMLRVGEGYYGWHHTTEAKHEIAMSDAKGETVPPSPP